MKIAISNIAWHSQEEEKISNILQELGINGVEIAPTKIWQSPLSAIDSEIFDYRKWWENKGIEIVAMQALLFGKPELTIFESLEKRRQTLEYLSRMIVLANKLGVKSLVFGSPKNRNTENKDKQEVQKIAISFFHSLGEFAKQNNVFFCIEPNPLDYGCNFITTSEEGLELVNQVQSEGFKLHLDAAGMTLSNENVESAIEVAFKQLCHFHISEPYLAQIGIGKVQHHLFDKTLARLGYKGWISIEMKAQSSDSNLESVTKALQVALSSYARS